MKIVYKKSVGILILTSLLIGLAGCSSASDDPIGDVTKLFAMISRIERQNPGGMNFTEEQANQVIEIINPVVAGLPFTSELAQQMLKDMDKLLTKEQQALIDESIAAIGTQQQGGGTGMPGSGGGGGITGGGGTPGSPGSGPSGSPDGGNGLNMFLRVDEIITNNYLTN